MGLSISIVAHDVCNSTLLFNYSSTTLLNIFGVVLMILLPPLLCDTIQSFNAAVTVYPYLNHKYMVFYST